MLRSVRLLILVLVAMLATAACGSGLQEAAEEEPEGAAEATTAESDGGEGVAVEGDLLFYTSQPDADASALVEAFNEQYPDVNVEIFRSGTEEVVSRLLAEEEAAEIQADVLLVADEVTFATLKAEDLLMSYQSSEMEAIPSSFVDEDHTYTGTKAIVTGMMVNTNEVDEVPSSWRALVEHADEAVMPSPLYSGAAAYNIGVLTRLPDFGWEFFEQLAEGGMTVVQGNGAVLEAVASGQQSYGMVVTFIVHRAAEQGSPVEAVYPEDGVLVITEPVGILNNTDNEPAAKAFVDFVLSEDGQALAAELGYIPIREGVAPPAGAPSIDELTVLEGPLEELIEGREEDARRFTATLGQ